MTGAKLSLEHSPRQAGNKRWLSKIGRRSLVDVGSSRCPPSLLCRAVVSTVGLGIFMMFFGDLTFAVNDIMGKWPGAAVRRDRRRRSHGGGRAWRP